ncbi:polysaccharide biosynthesis protein [bacterium]|nr:polysaccharide biosynthesis protein [bacterium]
MTIDKFSNTYLRLLVKIFLDATLFYVAFIISYCIRFQPEAAFIHLDKIKYFLILAVLIQITGFGLFRLWSSMWRYAGTYDLVQLVKATTFCNGVVIAAWFFLRNYEFFFPEKAVLPRSIIPTDWLLVVILNGSMRLAIRKIYSSGFGSLRKRSSYKRVLIYGAGSASEILLRNIESSREIGLNVIGLLDDDPAKFGKYIHNKKILGDRTKISEFVNKYKINAIYFSIPSLPGVEVRKILKAIGEQVEDGVEVKTIPGLTDIVSDRVTLNELRKFEIKDLLRRKPVELNFAPVRELITDKTVIVVGAGGSIGFELCCQIAAFRPDKLLILDNSEFNIYSAESTINEQYPDLTLIPIVADVTNEPIVRRIFEQYKPSLLFHAAAYKHVPLMEINPWSAVYNNLQSTLVLSRLAIENNVKRFILISTDKAVRPSSVMGATKRVCEIMSHVHHLADDTEFIVVRFGNVLGSSGSVIPKFKKQISNGGPITVTHPEITRYFMLVSEAVELVLQAGAVGESGNTYVLDMGEPIAIVDLARYMIELSGLKENDDIKIEFTGLRPGEKLRESLYFEGKEIATRVPNLLVLHPKIEFDKKYLRKVDTLITRLPELDHRNLIKELQELVPEYDPNQSENGYVKDILGYDN